MSMLMMRNGDAPEHRPEAEMNSILFLKVPSSTYTMCVCIYIYIYSFT